MASFFNLLAAGTGSLSFEQRRTALDIEGGRYKRRIMPIKPRTPYEIMKETWDDVGRSMWNAMGVIGKEYGQQITQPK
ncbi:MAG: hypothetical protein FWC15_07215 [Fibromonadales bacterium]|nr:hypothetical protein [Fibromonadales bacterium]